MSSQSTTSPSTLHLAPPRVPSANLNVSSDVLSLVPSPPSLSRSTSMISSTSVTTARMVHKGQVVQVRIPQEVEFKESVKDIIEKLREIIEAVLEIGGTDPLSRDEFKFEIPGLDENGSREPFVVHIPDLDDWNRHIAHIRTQKLRSLDLTFSEQPTHDPLGPLQYSTSIHQVSSNPPSRSNSDSALATENDNTPHTSVPYPLQSRVSPQYQQQPISQTRFISQAYLNPASPGSPTQLQDTGHWSQAGTSLREDQDLIFPQQQERSSSKSRRSALDDWTPEKIIEMHTTGFGEADSQHGTVDSEKEETLINPFENDKENFKINPTQNSTSPKTEPVAQKPFHFGGRGGHSSSSSIVGKLNASAPEFVFRPPALLGQKPSEPSPIGLQRASGSLFNVLAPEFKPIISRPSVTSLQKDRVGAIFRLPSPTKKAIPIVRPETEDVGVTRKKRRGVTPDDEISTELDSDENRQRKSVRQRDTSVTTPEEKNFKKHRGTFESPTEEPMTVRRLRPSKVDDNGDDDEDEDLESFEGLPRGWSEEREGRRKKAQESIQGVWDSSNERRSTNLGTEASPLRPNNESLREELGGSDKENEGYNGLSVLKDEAQGGHDVEESSDASNSLLEVSQHDPHSVEGERILAKPTGLLVRQNVVGREEIISAMKEELQPLVRIVEYLQMSLSRTAGRKSKRSRDGSEADDESDGGDVERPVSKDGPRPRKGTWDLEKLRTVVIEVLRTEQEMFNRSTLPQPPLSDTKEIGNQRASTEIKELRLVADGLKSKLLELEIALSTSEKRCSEGNKTIDKMEIDLKNLQQEIGNKALNIENLEVEVQSLIGERDELRQELENNLRRELERTEEIKRLETEIGSLVIKIRKLESGMEKKENDLIDKQKDISQLRDSIGEARGEEGKMRRENNRLMEELEVEKRRNAQLQNQLESTAKEIAIEQGKLVEELRTERTIRENVERRLVEEERRVHGSENEIGQLKILAEEGIRIQVMYEEVTKRVGIAEKAKTEAERTLWERENMVGNLRKEKGDFQGRMQLMEEELSKIIGMKDMLEKEVTYEKAGREKADQKVLGFQNEIEYIKKHSTEREKFYTIIEADLLNRKAEVGKLSAQIENVQHRLNEEQEQKEKLFHKIENLKDEVGDKEKAILELEFLVASTPQQTITQQDVDILETKIHRRDREIAKLREILASLVHDNEELLLPLDSGASREKKFNALKNILTGERERNKGVQRELAKIIVRVGNESNGGLGTPRGGANVNSIVDQIGAENPSTITYESPLALRTPRETPELSPLVERTIGGDEI